MAFMVPVMQKDWDLYGCGPARGGRRDGQRSRSAPQSRRSSQVSGGLSRQTSACSAGSAATAPGLSLQAPRSAPVSCRRGSRAGEPGSAPRSVTFGPPSPPCASRTAAKQAEKGNFHTKVVDKLMRVLHRGEKEGARRS